jgi:dihydropyrimidinase
MSELDVIVRGGEVVSPRGIVRADVGIADGKIVAVGDDLPGRAKRVIDAEGKHVLPGVIDPHVHMTSAGKTVEQSCIEETPSMLAGGVTTCLHFCQSYDSYLPVFERDREAVNRCSLVDVGFHAMLMKEIHLEELPRYHREHGVSSYKLFFAAGGAELYPGTQAVDDGFLYRGFREIAKLGDGVTAMAHCENWEIANALAAELEAEGRTDAAAWSDSRPDFCEEEGIRRAIFLAGLNRCPLYIVHASTAEAAGLVERAAVDGHRVVAETCPHYLTFHRDHPDVIRAKYNPAVKEEHDLDGLWKGLRDGWISTLGSDHIPVRAKDKDLTGKDIWTARGGTPGSGTILPVLLSEGVNRGRLSIEQVAAVSSENVAKVFGLWPRKGAVAPGADADIVLVDLARAVTVTPEQFHLDYVLYDGWQIKGWPTLAMLRGEVAMEDGEITAEHGVGRYVRDVKPG